jgi:hypothetical protein
MKNRAPSPTWKSKRIMVSLRGSGMPALEATALEVVLPGGAIASQREADAAAIWPSARLRLVFGVSVNWYGATGGAWQKRAIAVAMKLAKLVAPTFIVSDVTGRLDLPVLKPIAYSKSAAERMAARVLFADHENPNAWAVIRSGGPHDVAYGASLLVLSDALQLHLPPGSEGKLAALLADIVDEVPFAWAGVGQGLGGWASALALARNTAKGRTKIGTTSLVDLAQTAPKSGIDEQLWLGTAWTAETLDDVERTKLLAKIVRGRKVEPRGDLVRVVVKRPAARKLAADLQSTIAAARELARRRVLRRRSP